jgi:hypothetical protein
MKMLLSIFALVLVIISLTISSCKKAEINRSCGCDSIDTKYFLQNMNGILCYHAYNNKWKFSYSPSQGNYANYFPCKYTQDSLQAILQHANNNDAFNINILGKVKSPCPGENFGITSGVTTFDYIIIDSLKRN